MPIQGRHFAICNGPWQAIMVSAACRSLGLRRETGRHFLLIQVREEEEHLVEIIRLLAEGSGVWSEIKVEVFQVRSSAIGSLAMAIVKRERTLDFEWLWLPNINHRCFRIYAALFSKADICIYEEGLASYASDYFCPSTASGLNASFLAISLASIAVPTAMRRASSLIHPGRIQQLRKRVRRAFFTEAGADLVKDFTLAIEHIPNDALRFVAEAADPPHDVSIPKGACWILDGNFGWHPGMTYEAEYQRYLETARRFLGEGVPVVFKPHPRSRQPMAQRLMEDTSGGIVAVPPKLRSWPVECLYAAYEPTAVCALASSSLVYAQIFGVRAYHFPESADNNGPSGGFSLSIQARLAVASSKPVESAFRSL